MNSISLTKKQLKNLTPLSINGKVKNTESQIYILDYGNWQHSDGNLLLKKLFIINNEYMASKLFNVSLLGDKREEIDMEELVIPNYLATMDNEIIGFTVPRIFDSTNLSLILSDTKIDNSDKIQLLYKVGKLLKKVDSLRRKKIINLHLGDLHEDNILVTKDNNIKVIDLDSVYLGTNYPPVSHYLTTNKNLIYFGRKYKKNKDDIVYPTKSSDLLCYNMMILNTIARQNINRLDISEYFSYVNYLEYLGFGTDVINSFKRIYSQGANINSADFFDQIPLEKIGEAGFKVYQMKKDKGIIKF